MWRVPFRAFAHAWTAPQLEDEADHFPALHSGAVNAEMPLTVELYGSPLAGRSTAEERVATQHIR